MQLSTILTIVKYLFLLLAILIPLFFIYAGYVKRKKIKKSRKLQRRLSLLIVIPFLFNFAIFKMIRVSSSAVLDDKRDVEITKIEPKEEKIEVQDVSKDANITKNGFKIEQIDGITYIDGYIIVNKTYSLPADYYPKDTHKSISADTGICETCINEEAYKQYELITYKHI